MSKVLGLLTLNELDIIETDENPSIGSGLKANVGCLALIAYSKNPMFIKTGILDTDWKSYSPTNDYARYSNADTSQNLNISTSVNFDTKINIFGYVYKSSSDFTLAGQDLICNFTGDVDLSANVHIFSSNTRTSILISFKLNGNLIGATGAGSYIRNTNGNNESGISLNTSISVNQGDIISLHSRREGNSGTTRMTKAQTSEIIVKRV